MTGTRDKVARFLYRNDGNPDLPEDRQWESLSLYWKFKYLKLADQLLREIADEPLGTVKE